MKNKNINKEYLKKELYSLDKSLFDKIRSLNTYLEKHVNYETIDAKS